MKRAWAFLLIAVVLIGSGLAYAAGGSAEDPLVSLSFLNGTYLPDVLSQAEKRIETRTQTTYDQVFQELNQAYQENLAEAGGSSGLRDDRYKEGDVLSVSTGSGLLFLAGEAAVTYSAGAVVDVTAGNVVPSGQRLTPMHRYLAAEGTSAVVSIVSETAVVSTEGVVTLSPSAATDYNAMAEALQQMGMFAGTGTGYGSGYDLEKIPTRIEGLIMFLRMIGEEKQAQAYTGACPFVDVPDWCRSYVAYAYEKGYAAGVGPTAEGKPAFGPERTIGAGEYLTFLLRALGYRDSGSNPDFTWQTVLPRARELGVITPGEYTLLSSSTFLRAHVAYLSYFGLDATCKEGGTLLESLSASGALDGEQVKAIRSQVTVSRIA